VFSNITVLATMYKKSPKKSKTPTLKEICRRFREMVLKLDEELGVERLRVVWYVLQLQFGLCAYATLVRCLFYAAVYRWWN
jgi:hypothetical protein